MQMHLGAMVAFRIAPKLTMRREAVSSVKTKHVSQRVNHAALRGANPVLGHNLTATNSAPL
jgi:hypothetical protein